MLFHLFHEASNCGNITQFSWKSDKSTYVLDKESHCHFLIDDHVTFLTVVSHDYSVGNGSNLTWSLDVLFMAYTILKFITLNSTLIRF